MSKNDENTSGDVIISPPAGRIRITGYAPTVWITSYFAEAWFVDAIRESKETGKDARRREIIFSIAFAESYLLELIRDSILDSDYSKLSNYFKPGDRKGVKDKWKDIPKELMNDGYINNLPDLGQQYWENWSEIADYRNGLIHARASRPNSSSIPDDIKPMPDSKVLSEMNPGRPISDTIKMITEFHKAVEIDLPDWLQI